MRRFIFILTIAYLSFLPATAQEDDKGYLVNLLQDTLSDAGREVSIDGFEGVLSSRATLERMSIADDDGVWLSLENAVLEWSRSALLSGRLEITELSAATLSVARPPKPSSDALPAAEATGFSLPELPVSVNIGALKVDRIVLGAPVLGEAAEMRLSANATLDGGTAALKLNAVRLDGKTGEFAIDSAFEASSELLKLDLSLLEGADGIVSRLIGLPGAPDLSLSLKGLGPLGDFAADISLATRQTERLAGRVTLNDREGGRGFDADLAGDVSSLFQPQYQGFFGTDASLKATGQSLADGRMQLDSFALRTDALDLTGTAALDPTGWPSLLDINGRVANRDGSKVVLPISGPRTEVSGLALDIQFDADRGDAWTGAFDLEELSRPELTLARSRIDADGILQGATGQLGRVEADIKLAATGLEMADPALAEAAGDTIAGALSVTFEQGAPLRLDDLQLRAGDLAVTGNAQVDGLEDALETTLDLALDAQDLRRFAALSGQDLRGQARFDLEGALDLGGAFDLTLGGTANALAIGQDQADALLAGQTTLAIGIARNTNGTQLRQMALSNPQLMLEASGDVATGAADLKFDAKLNEAGLLSPELSGPLTLNGTAKQAGELWTIATDAAGPFEATARLRAELEGPRTDIELAATLPEAAEIAPQLSGPLQIDAAASKLGDGWQIAADASGPFDATARIEGLLGQSSRFDYSAALPDASALTPELEGALTLAGRAEQMGSSWRITAQASGPFDAEADIDAEIDGAEIGLDFTAQLPEIARLTPQLSGPLTLQGRAEQRDAIWSVKARAAGPYDGSATVDAVIDGDDIGADFTAQLPDTSQLAPQLRGPLSVQGRAEQSNAIWSVKADAEGPYEGRAEVDATIDGAAIAVDFSAGLPNLAPLVAQLPGALDLNGSAKTAGNGWDLNASARGPSGLSGNLAGQYLDGGSAFEFDAKLQDTAVFVPQIGGTLAVSGTARQQQSGWILSTEGTGPGGMQFASSGTLSNDTTLDMQLRGTAPLGLANPFLTPRSIDGDAQFDLAVRGAPALSSLSGRVQSSGARVNLPSLRAALTDLETRVDLQSGRADLTLQAALSSGGTIGVRGPVTLSDRYPAELEVALDGLGLSDPQLYKTILDGALRISGPLQGGAQISGQIDLGQTDLTVPSTGLTSFGEIPQITHIRSPRPVQRSRARAGLDETASQTETAAQSGPVFPLDIALNAPSRIFIRGRGLDAELAGGVRVTGTTANLITAGQFELQRGRLDILGKRFTLDEGNVQLQGSPDPALRFVATTELPDGSASIVISGRASAPEVSFVSVPAAPQDEVLARIFFGRNASQLSPFQALQLASAVATLAGRGGEGVVSKLRRGLDLDDLDVATDTDGNTQLRAGKYVSDNVYTDITIGTGGTGAVSLNLDISPSVTARGRLQADGDTSLGIFFERDY